jgi:hypothetical protein
MQRIFIAQSRVDLWESQQQVFLQGDFIRMVDYPELAIYISPAVYFERVDGSTNDPYDIVGAVKSAEELANMGADHYDSSVVLGDHAYTVSPGFVAIPVEDTGAVAELDSFRWGKLVSALEVGGAS